MVVLLTFNILAAVFWINFLDFLKIVLRGFIKSSSIFLFVFLRARAPKIATVVNNILERVFRSLNGSVVVAVCRPGA
jgi:hypothetical protein